MAKTANDKKQRSAGAERGQAHTYRKRVHRSPGDTLRGPAPTIKITEPGWPSVKQKELDLIPISSLLKSYGQCLATLPTAINEMLQWFTSLPILMQNHPDGCSVASGTDILFPHLLAISVSASTSPKKASRRYFTQNNDRYDTTSSSLPRMTTFHPEQRPLWYNVLILTKGGDIPPRATTAMVQRPHPYQGWRHSAQSNDRYGTTSSSLPRMATFRPDQRPLRYNVLILTKDGNIAPGTTTATVQRPHPYQGWQHCARSNDRYGTTSSSLPRMATLHPEQRPLRYNVLILTKDGNIAPGTTTAVIQRPHP